MKIQSKVIHDIKSDKTGANLGTIVLNRSEEHTSELQSHSDLVCRLLLEKKKQTKKKKKKTKKKKTKNDKHTIKSND